jgi:xanthine phosphoribosyltransferase
MSSSAPLSAARDFPVSWEELHRHAKALAWRLIGQGPLNGQWRAVIGVARGGLIPATIIAREMGIHVVDTICVTHYDELVALPEPKMTKMVAGDGQGCLIIDDLVDTGKTFEVVRKYLPKAHYATIYAKPEGKPQVDSYVMEISQDTWVHFPWESSMRYTEPLAQQKAAKS